MKSSGIVRKMDELGRIVLPIEMRRQLNIEERDPVEISFEKDKIILRKHQESCVFCSSKSKLVEHMGKFVCSDCLNSMNEANQ